MLQYKIPQDVGVADKIVGPLTLRQLIIVAIGGGISYVLFAIASKLYELNILEYIIIALPALIALAAAFIKINNIPFTKFVLLSLEYAIKPKQRLWDHRGISSIVAPYLGEKRPAKSVVQGEGVKTKKDINLDDLSRVLDSGGFENVEEVKHEGIDHAADDDLMTEAYFGHKKEKSETENMYWRTKGSHKKRLDMLAKMPATKPKSAKPIKPATTKAVETPATVAEPSSVSPRTPSEAEGDRPTPEGQAHGPRAKPRGTGLREAGPPRLAGEKPFKKKKRRRRKKPKAQPARSETQIDTTQRKKPAKFTPKKSEVTTTPTPPKEHGPIPEPNKGGEIYLEELKKGEIELNLD